MESITHVPDVVAKIAFVSTTKRDEVRSFAARAVRATILVMASSYWSTQGRLQAPLRPFIWLPSLWGPMDPKRAQ